MRICCRRFWGIRKKSGEEHTREIDVEVLLVLETRRDMAFAWKTIMHIDVKKMKKRPKKTNFWRVRASCAFFVCGLEMKELNWVSFNFFCGCGLDCVYISAHETISISRTAYFDELGYGKAKPNRLQLRCQTGGNLF